MLLPGKLTLGFLQEDNPQKFFFRVSPLMIKDENGYQLVEDARQEYQEDGFIRIVPDKNEMNHFKTRMRNLGRYCLLDLRRHTGENDKIRPNKNHAGENGDRNAFIVYSDVIFQLPADFMAEAVEPDQDGLFPCPGTKWVAVMQSGRIAGLYAWSERGESACIVGDSLNTGSMENAADRLITLRVNGADVRVLMDLTQWGLRAESEKADEPAKPEPKPEPRPEKNAARPDESDKSAESAPPAEPAARAPQTNEPAAPAPEAEKPWLQHTTFVFPRVVSSKLPARRQSIQQQSGFNPRRSVGIKDIVDDMWRQSRFDQLGHPVPPEATGTPVVSPIDRAMDAVRDAWKLPEARASLISSLLRLDGMDAALGADSSGNPADVRKARSCEQQLDRLEADRLKLLCEIDELKKLRADKRAELIGELKTAGNAELAKTEKRNQALLEARAQYQQEAESARRAAETAEKAFQDVLSNQLDERMARLLAEGRARDLMTAMAHAACKPAEPAETYEPSAGELISDVRVRFEEAGITLSNDEAVNLLACLALGRVIAVSGPTGSGKSSYVRTLAAALGIAAPRLGRFVELQPESDWHSLGRMIEEIGPNGVPVVKMPELKRVLETEDEAVPAMLMLDDANRAPVDRYLGDLLSQTDRDAAGRLVTGAGSLRLSGALRVFLTLQDAAEGMVIGAKLLDRAWLLRLTCEAPDTPWQPRKAAPPHPDKAVSMETFRKVFDTSRDVPGEILERMKLLREKLGAVGVRISRRALDDMYDYCAAVTPLMTCPPIAVLDYAFAQRAMPAILACANLDALHALPELLPDMPRSLNLMLAPLPLPPI